MTRVIVVDTECYPNFWFAAFVDPLNGKTLEFEQSERSSTFNRGAVDAIMRNYTTVGFNSLKYDLPMIALALKGVSNEDLKRASDMLIVGQMAPWTFADYWGIKIPRTRGNRLRESIWDHIDVSEVAPGVMISLKQYGARLHAKRLQDLPLHDKAILTREQMGAVKDYCIAGDIKSLTIPLFESLREPLQLRESLTEEYDVDLRSKSDAQIAEAVINKRVSTLLGWDIARPEIPAGTPIRYKAPPFIRFRTEQMQQTLALIERLTFVLGDNGSPMMPEELAKLRITMGSSTYQLGMGGLHSREESVSHYADDEWALIDRDVASYYPKIKDICELYPRHLGKQYLHVYRDIIRKRLDAKKVKNKVVAESLKITINGAFGKLGSKWSKIYAPDLMLQVTITGQLALLMLIEAIEEWSDHFGVVSANTDGIVIRARKRSLTILQKIIKAWELATGFETEETEYRSLHSRDVNSYVAVKLDGSTKGKGEFTLPAPGDFRAVLQKTPDGDICIEAVHQFLAHGTSIHKTIFGCTDVRKFLMARRVNGGAIYDGQYLGRVVRWYVAVGMTKTINYVRLTAKQSEKGQQVGNKVPESDGAKPLMTLPDKLPSDIDFDYYIQRAIKMLRSVGVR